VAFRQVFSVRNCLCTGGALRIRGPVRQCLSKHDVDCIRCADYSIGALIPAAVADLPVAACCHFPGHCPPRIRFRYMDAHRGGSADHRDRCAQGLRRGCVDLPFYSPSGSSVWSARIRPLRDWRDYAHGGERDVVRARGRKHVGASIAVAHLAHLVAERCAGDHDGRPRGVELVRWRKTLAADRQFRTTLGICRRLDRHGCVGLPRPGLRQSAATGISQLSHLDSAGLRLVGDPLSRVAGGGRGLDARVGRGHRAGRRRRPVRPSRTASARARPRHADLSCSVC
jgi:hypothetical protein